MLFFGVIDICRFILRRTTENGSKREQTLPDVQVAKCIDVFPYFSNELLVSRNLWQLLELLLPRNANTRLNLRFLLFGHLDNSIFVGYVRGSLNQYSPYSRVNSVMALMFSTLASFWIMALASMM